MVSAINLNLLTDMSYRVMALMQVGLTYPQLPCQHKLGEFQENILRQTEQMQVVWCLMLIRQTGNAGKALVTNGVTVSWGDIDAYPDQSEISESSFQRMEAR